MALINYAMSPLNIFPARLAVAAHEFSPGECAWGNASEAYSKILAPIWGKGAVFKVLINQSIGK